MNLLVAAMVIKFLVLQHWFDPDEGSGFLYNYLTDPKHIFTDPLSKNITKLAHNLSSSDLDLVGQACHRSIAE